MELELGGGWVGAGQGLLLGPGVPSQEPKVTVHGDALEWGPQNKQLTAEWPPDLQSQAKLSCTSGEGGVLWENWLIMHPFL